jgi:hypothetical protein
MAPSLALLAIFLVISATHSLYAPLKTTRAANPHFNGRWRSSLSYPLSAAADGSTVDDAVGTAASSPVASTAAVDEEEESCCDLMSTSVSNNNSNAAEDDEGDGFKQKVIVVVPSDASSPFFTKPEMGAVQWWTVFEHVASKIGWESQNNKYDKFKGRDLKVRT